MTWRQPDREDRRVAALWAVCAAAAVLLRPVWIAGAGVLPRCPWRAWTGWPCPGCGTTRAMLRLLHLDPAGALALNPLAASGAMLFVAAGLAAPVWLAVGGRALTITLRPRLLWAAIGGVLFAANWGWLVIARV